MHHDIARLTQLARLIAPDFSEQPVYVVGKYALPDGVFPGNVCGFFKSDLAGYMRPLLEERGDWRGNGITLVVSGGMFPVQAARLAHEIGHAVVDRREFGPLFELDQQYDLADLRKSVDDQDERMVTTGAQPWAAGHQLEFIRCALHLAHRVERHGTKVATGHLFGTTYGLSDFGEYRAALTPELASSDWQAPLVEIFEQSPPAEFSALWCADVRASLGSNPSQTASAIARLELSKWEPTGVFKKCG